MTAKAQGPEAVESTTASATLVCDSNRLIRVIEASLSDLVQSYRQFLCLILAPSVLYGRCRDAKCS